MIVILQQQISENAEPDAVIFLMKSETYFDDNWLLWCLRKDKNEKKTIILTVILPFSICHFK